MFGTLFALLVTVSACQADETLPAPTGPHKTGRMSFHWKDAARDELETSTPDDKRELMVHLFYPAVANTSGERAAYVLPDVLAHAAREATIERRRLYAESIRAMLAEPDWASDGRARTVAEGLEALADDLEDEGLSLEPACAVACMRLVTDPSSSPLFRFDLSPEDLRSRVRQIRSGFRPGR